MKAKVVLAARVSDADAGFPFVNVEIRRNSVQFPIVRHDRRRGTKSFGPAEIVGFYARCVENGKRKLKPLGKDPVAAFVQYQQIEQDFSRVRLGLLPLRPTADSPATAVDTHDIEACSRDFKKQIVSQGLKPRSVETYETSIDNFVAGCRRVSLDDVTERDMLDFVDWMRANLPKRKFGQQANTYRNRLKDLNVFFNRYGLKMPLAKKKWPKATKNNPDKYSIDSVNRMLKVADRDETDLISFFLYTGFRDEEAAYAKYSDFDFQNGTINVHDKPEYNWTVKDHEQRSQDIILPDKFVKRMQARRDRYKAKASDLIFPSGAGTPSTKLIRIAQRVGRRAELEERVTLHKFRRTFGTLVAKQFGIEQARIWLGHSDIATTQRYLAADEMVTDQSKKAVNKMFGVVGD